MEETGPNWTANRLDGNLIGSLGGPALIAVLCDHGSGPETEFSSVSSANMLAMRLELRVCQHCLEGDDGHGGHHKSELLQDMVKCAEVLQEHKEVLDLNAVHIRRVRDDEQGKPEALPVVAATIQNDQIVLNDTQLVAEGQDGNMLLYANPSDILTVLAGNVDEISKAVPEDVSVSLSEPGAEIITDAGLGADPDRQPDQ